MLMPRANLQWNLIMGIGAATFGLILLTKIIDDPFNAPAYCVVGLLASVVGLDKILHTTQSLEITPTEIIYQTAFRIACIKWDKIGSYVLDADRFVALDKQHGKILLDIELRGDDNTAWPAQECAQVVKFIEQKMNEVGAYRESTLWLRHNHGIKIKP